MPDGTETVAVFVTVPLAADEIVAGTVNVAVPPARRFTVAAMLPVPEAGHVEPDDATHVQVPKVTLAGAVSVTVAPTTPPGPALDTTIVYVVAPPAVTALTPFVFVTLRSANTSSSVLVTATSLALTPL